MSDAKSRESAQALYDALPNHDVHFQKSPGMAAALLAAGVIRDDQPLDGIKARLAAAERAWGWHEAGPDPDGDEVLAGYGPHMSQMLYRLPRDGQTADMKASVEQMLADLRALIYDEAWRA